MQESETKDHLPPALETHLQLPPQAAGGAGGVGGEASE